jgi:non-ribosomal peptide synthetase component E (peptide arylation enzyme)
MNDRRVERVLDTGTSGLSTNQATRILLALVLIGGCTLRLRKGMTKGAVTYTTLTMPTGLATLTWWNTEAGRGCHYPPATTSSLWG